MGWVRGKLGGPYALFVHHSGQRHSDGSHARKFSPLRRSLNCSQQTTIFCVLEKKTPADRNTSRELEPSNFRQSPEAVLIDFRRPNLRFQRGPRDAQLGRSPLGSEYPAATFFQGGLNHVLLLGWATCRCHVAGFLFLWHCSERLYTYRQSAVKKGNLMPDDVDALETKRSKLLEEIGRASCRERV